MRPRLHVHIKFVRVRGGSLSKSEVSEGLVARFLSPFLKSKACFANGNYPLFIALRHETQESMDMVNKMSQFCGNCL